MIHWRIFRLSWLIRVFLQRATAQSNQTRPKKTLPVAWIIKKTIERSHDGSSTKWSSSKTTTEQFLTHPHIGKFARWKNSPKSLCSVMSAKESVLSRRTGVNWSLLYCANAEPAFSLSKLSFFNKTRTSLKTSLNSPEITEISIVGGLNKRFHTWRSVQDEVGDNANLFGISYFLLVRHFTISRFYSAKIMFRFVTRLMTKSELCGVEVYCVLKHGASRSLKFSWPLFIYFSIFSRYIFFYLRGAPPL